jgi:cytochrome c oxidase subunit IV
MQISSKSSQSSTLHSLEIYQLLLVALKVVWLVEFVVLRNTRNKRGLVLILMVVICGLLVLVALLLKMR